MKKTLFVMTLIMATAITSATAQLPAGSIPGTDTVKYDHVPGTGILVAKNKFGSLSIAALANLRYLNQLSTESSYTDASGRTIPVQRRNDFLLSKLNVYFRGWLFNEKFRYNFWYWTSNANMGQGAQVVGGGDMKYEFNKHLTLSGGIQALPCVRTTLYNFPNWLTEDARSIADEFFRGSYTMGIWAQGEITKNLYYKTMLGDNLSILGVDAGQLDNGFGTWSAALWWVTNDYGRNMPFSDFEYHKKPATVIGGAYTNSKESRQSQAGSEAPENSQIRLSDGTGVFSVDAFVPGSQITVARYEMATCFTGVKYKGFSLDLDVYMRWVSHFTTVGEVPVSSLFDNGYSVSAAYMLLDKTLELHIIGSYINGQYGQPYDMIGGINFFPYKNRTLRFNADVRYAYHSPVGYLAFPTFVGSTGPIYIANMELNF
jgi:hypothetical protein